MEEVVTSIFPTRKVFHSLSSLNEADIATSLKKVETFLKNNPGIKVEEGIPRTGAQWDGIARRARREIVRHLRNLRRLSRRYTHLGINSSLNARNRSTTQKMAAIRSLGAKLGKFIADNPGFDLLTANFHPKRQYVRRVVGRNDARRLKINWAGFSANEKHSLVSQLKLYQRLYRIYPRLEAVAALLEEGFNSARQVAAIPESIFVARYYRRLGRDKQFASKIHKFAQKRVNRRIFLYPENWLHPELRDDKSPLFKELEDELLQGEIIEVSVERAYKNYLDRFVQLANLTIAGAYCDDEQDI